MAGARLRLQPGTDNSIQVPHVGERNPNYLSHHHCLPSHWLKADIRSQSCILKKSVKPKESHTGCGHLNWCFNYMLLPSLPFFLCCVSWYHLHEESPIMSLHVTFPLLPQYTGGPDMFTIYFNIDICHLVLLIRYSLTAIKRKGGHFMFIFFDSQVCAFISILLLSLQL